jgi:GNAT superfamily N-acetyltransferase
MIGAPWHLLAGPRLWATVTVALVATHGFAWWHGWDARGDREAARVAVLVAEREGIARALFRAAAEAAQHRAALAALALEVDAIERAHRTADRECLPADSVRRLNGR